MLALLLDSVGLSRSLVLLSGIASPQTFVLSRETSLILSIDYLRSSSLTGPGSGAPLSSYLEGALYKFHRYIDRYTVCRYVILRYQVPSREMIHLFKIPSMSSWKRSCI